jgi:glutathione gamma-glutamylcysteinyltransferase
MMKRTRQLISMAARRWKVWDGIGFVRIDSRYIRNTRGLSTNSFHKRPLPKELVPFSSIQGKALFREALSEGGMESFFALSEQFVTQSEPSYCAFSSLAMVLNALNYDPMKVWKGAWRWVSEELLHCESSEICTHQSAQVLSRGMNFKEFEMLGTCHGVCIKSYPAVESDALGMEAFRKVVSEVSSSDKAEQFIISNFSRKALLQTGNGHFSPIGGYLPSKDLVLVMDVARFKYPPFWVPLADLWKSMVVQDDESGDSRGYFVVSVLETASKNAEFNHECSHQKTCGHQHHKNISAGDSSLPKLHVPTAG